MAQKPTVAQENNLFATLPMEQLILPDIDEKEVDTTTTSATRTSLADIDDEIEIIHQDESDPLTTCEVSLVIQAKYWSGKGKVPGYACLCFVYLFVACC